MRGSLRRPSTKPTRMIMSTKEQIEEKAYRLQCKAYDYYRNNIKRRNQFCRLITLLAARKGHPDCFKRPQTTWKECWDWAFRK